MLNYLCPHRCAVACKNAPTIVLPERQYITAGLQRSIEVESAGDMLLNFFHHVFTIPMQFWKQHPTTSSIFPSSSQADVTVESVRVYTYPIENIFNNEGIPVSLIEWDWEGVESPEEALAQIRKYYFHPSYIDNESDYSLVETFPKTNNSRIANSTVFRALWRPRLGFAKRDWVEYVGVNEKEKMLVSRSCMHPRFNECAPEKTLMQKLLEFFLPIGLIRAGCVYGCQFKPPRKGNKGCIVRVFCWYKMVGIVDILMILGVPQVVNEMRKSTIKQFIAMAKFLQAEKNSEPEQKPPFDLIN